MRNFACSKKVFLMQKRPIFGRFIVDEVNFFKSLRISVNYQLFSLRKKLQKSKNPCRIYRLCQFCLAPKLLSPPQVEILLRQNLLGTTANFHGLQIFAPHVKFAQKYGEGKYKQGLFSFISWLRRACRSPFCRALSCPHSSRCPSSLLSLGRKEVRRQGTF